MKVSKQQQQVMKFKFNTNLFDINYNVFITSSISVRAWKLFKGICFKCSLYLFLVLFLTVF